MILDKISRLPLYESLIPGAGQIAAAFLAHSPQAVPFEVREKSYAQKDSYLSNNESTKGSKTK